MRRLAYRGRHHRRAWNGQRLHFEVRGLGAGGPAVDRRGLPAVDRQALAAAIESRLAELVGVRWAVANPVLGRVIVAVADDADPPVLEAIEAVEAEFGVARARFAPTIPDHPADREPIWRAGTAMAADLGGLVLAAGGAAARITPIPSEIASIVALFDGEAHLRGLAADVIGPVIADVGLAIANATAQGLAHGPVGVLSDLAWRAAHLAEASSRRRGWELVEERLTGSPDAAAAPLFDPADRPAPIPAGPVERYIERAAVGSAVAAVPAVIGTGDLGRAAAALYAGLPKAARLGREVFAVHVTRWLTGHGGVVLDDQAIRRLDRVDTVVVESAAARSAWGRAVVAAARAAGHMVVVAGPAAAAKGLDADLRVAGGQRLDAAVRELQVDGCVVLLVAGGSVAVADALWSADVGVGLLRPGAVPWSADVLMPPAEAWRVVDASGTAHELSRQSVALALVGAAGASAIVFGRPRSSRFGWPVNGAALVAMVNATRAGVALSRRAAPIDASTAVAWHSMSPADVMRRLGTGLAGLDGDEASARLPLERHPPTGLVRFVGAVIEELANPLTPLLAGGATLSAALGGTVDAGIVAGVTAANAMLGGLQRWRTEQAADALAAGRDIVVHVRRNGTLMSVGAREVVVGDLVVLRAGDVVPADARIVDADGVLADESTITGESVPVPKFALPVAAAAIADRTSMLYEGTSIAAGEVVAVVVAVGAETEAGAAMYGRRKATGGVEARLTDLTNRAIPITIGAGAAVVAAGALRGRGLTSGLTSGVSLAVAAVPEGLPLVATMAQLSAAQRLANQGALVRNHRAIEALGRVDVLCVDKTGTLTAGRLAVRAVSDLATDEGLEELSVSHRQVLAAALRATPEPEEGRRLAHPTDAAIVAAALTSGVEEGEGLPAWDRRDELPFEPAQGFHATTGRSGRRRLVSVKGAPEVVLPRCVRVRVPGRGSERMGAAVRAEIDRDIERLARRGLRVLAVAEGTIAGLPGDVSEDAVTGLSLLGLVAIADPVRPEAASAVEGLRRAGVGVCMVTGDHPSTAEGIAAELGILNGHRVMAGGQLAELSDEGLDACIEDVSVFARVTPADKVRIVQSFQRVGRVVAMTGDGANDAPAIRLADVGVAMGSHSTPAARAASDVIVTNDDIETIIAAIVEGRALWGSVRDALALLLGGNLGEIAFTLAGAFLGGGSPLSTRQLLLVNLLTDVAPALAIATRPPPRRTAEELLGEGPERSLGRPLERAIVGRAAITALGATAAWLPARLTGGPRRASTTALVALIGTQLAQTLSTGGTQPVVLLAGLGSAAVLVGIVQTPGVSQLFGCVPLDPLAWGQVVAGVGGAVGLSLVRPAVRSLGTWLTAALPGPEGKPAGSEPVDDRQHHEEARIA